jgi:hypothetical protein
LKNDEVMLLHLAANYVTAVLKICKRKHPQVRVGQAAINDFISLKKPKET